ncbi:MAG: CvpA family protein [Clostridia bacterium]|nr:CvpA family protein [Clostridia bacterium]
MILDVILVILFILMMLYGYKKGFVGIVAKLVSLILAFAIAYLLAETVGGYIARTSFGANIQTSIENSLLDKLNASEQSSVVSMIQQHLGLADEKAVVSNIVSYVLTGLGFVSVLIVVRIVLWIVQKILESIFELPVLKTFNKLGGVITSSVLFIIEVSIILAVIKSISTIAFMTRIVNIIQSSVITRVLYDHNIFTHLILSKIL